MLNSWERRAAENLTNAEHMRKVKQRIDMEYQEQLRQRERDREHAEAKREKRRGSPTPPPHTNKFRTRSYDRPWAVTKPPCKAKASVTSTKPRRSETQYSTNKRWMSRLPDITRGAQNHSPELAYTSKAPQRALAAPPATCNQRSPQRHIPFSVKPKARKLATPGHPLPVKTQSQSISVSKTETPHVPKDTLQCSDHTDATNTDCHHLPRPLISRRESQSNWLCLPVLRLNPSSLGSETPVQCLNPIESLSDTSSVAEELSTGKTLSRSSLQSSCDSSSSIEESLPSICYSSSLTLDAGTPEQSSSSEGTVSGHFPSLDALSSDEDSNLEEYSEPWNDLWSEIHQERTLWTTRRTSNNRLASTPRSHVSPDPSQLPQSSDSSSGQDVSTRSSSRVCCPMPALVQISGLAPSADGGLPTSDRRTCASTYRTDNCLPALEMRPGSSPRRLGQMGLGAGSPGSSVLSSTASLSASERNPEEGEEDQGAPGGRPLQGNDSPHNDASRASVSGLLNRLSSALLAVRDIRRVISENQTDTSHEMSKSLIFEGQSSRDPERLRRITERVLEEESDEEDGDMCRICQSQGTSLTNPLLAPCQCLGSLQYIHHDCLKKWIQTKIESGAELAVVKTCELCKGSLTWDLDDFDVEEYYHFHSQTQVEWERPDLYLLLLVQQRFSELLQVTQTRNNAISRHERTKSHLKSAVTHPQPEMVSLSMAARLFLLQQAAGIDGFGADGSRGYTDSERQEGRPERGHHDDSIGH